MNSEDQPPPAPARKQYVRAVGPRLRILLGGIFGLVALLGANSVYLVSIRALEAVRGLSFQNYFYMVMFGAHLVLGLLLVPAFLVFGVAHIKNAHDKNQEGWDQQQAQD